MILTPPEPTVGDACRVQWSDGMEYAATVLAIGKCLLESACSFLDVCICSQHYPRQALSCLNAYCTCTFTGNAAAARKAERELSQNLGKENQEEAAPKKRKVNTSIQKVKPLPKTPSRKSNKKRKPLVYSNSECRL